MLITEQSLAETLDGRADDRRRRCRLFMPDQAVFIPNKLLFSPRLVCSHPPDRRDGAIRPPDATLSRLCGDARPCNAWGIAETICGPDDMIVSRSVPLDVPADGAAAADWPTRRWRWWSAAV
jgi:hypothetical protein